MSKLSVENVSYRYQHGDRMVLSGVSCAFEPGQVTAVVGPSGSGKTTLLSILAGLDRPGGGSVTLDGEDLGKKDLDQYRRENVSVIFQAFQLFPLLPRRRAAGWGPKSRPAHGQTACLMFDMDFWLTAQPLPFPPGR